MVKGRGGTMAPALHEPGAEQRIRKFTGNKVAIQPRTPAKAIPMIRSKRPLLVFFGITLACLTVVGCQSNSAPPSASVGRSVIAGKTTFVEVPTGQGAPEVVAYTVSGQQVCPECKSVADDYFKTGKLDEQVCKTCGSTINVGQGAVLNSR
jgi:hypothetical protein